MNVYGIQTALYGNHPGEPVKGVGMGIEPGIEPIFGFGFVDENTGNPVHFTSRRQSQRPGFSNRKQPEREPGHRNA